MRDDEAALTAAIIADGRYGYRRIAAMLRDAGWVVNIKRVERIWRREGLKVPQKQPKRGRLWLNDGSCMRLRPLYPNHIWSYDFVEDRTHNGRKYRMLNVIDEFTRKSTRSQTCSSCVESLGTFVPTMARSSSPWPSASGLPPLEPRPPTSSEAVHGRSLLFLCAHVVRVAVTNNGRPQYGYRSGFYGLQNRGIEASSI